MNGPTIPQDAVIKEYAQGQYGMLIITFFLDQDKYYYTVNPLFVKKDNKWILLLKRPVFRQAFYFYPLSPYKSSVSTKTS